MKHGNYIAGFGWMFNELKLKGNDAWVYALIYGFSQDGKSKFEGGHQYIADTLNLERRSVIKILDRLLEKQYIIRSKVQVKNVFRSHYSVGSEFCSHVPVNKVHIGSEKSSHVGSEKSSHKNTIYRNTKENDNATDFLKINYPSTYESLSMKWKTQIKDWPRFLDRFNATVDKEGLAYDEHVLRGRFNLYADSWVYNQNKDNQLEGNSALAKLQVI